MNGLSSNPRTENIQHHLKTITKERVKFIQTRSTEFYKYIKNILDFK